MDISKAPAIVTPEPPRDLLGLLRQAEWWRPRVGPPVRVREMTDTHRLHTARFALNRVSVGLRVDFRLFVDAPLIRALLDGLPRPGDPGWDDLLSRAGHWSTCPRNRDLSAPACSSACELRLGPVCRLPACGCTGEAHP